MKILYIGHYRDGTGYGQAAEDYILSLDAVGVDIVCRPFKVNNLEHLPDRRILELENKNDKNCDIVIQHTLPCHIQYDSNFLLNICLFAYETSNFSMSGWQHHLNLMDDCIVINKQMLEACKNSGVKVPIHVVPHARDFSLYTQKFEKLELVKNNSTENDFIFYTIGEKNRRKNLSALLKAYFLEFQGNEDICLVIKTDKKEKENNEDINNFIDSISYGLKLSRTPKVVVINERLSNNAIMKLHNSCDVFVQPSYGEAWSIPAFDAMAFGKTPIVTNCTGYLEYIDDSVGWLVDCKNEPVFGSEHNVKDLYHSSEDWCAVNIYDLRKKMREAYSSKDLRKLKAANALDRAYEFSHEKVGLIFLEVLKQCLQRKEKQSG